MKKVSKKQNPRHENIMSAYTAYRVFQTGSYFSGRGDIGFGEYTIHVDNDGKWHGDSECMDRGEDKSFLKQLFDDILAQIEVE